MDREETIIPVVQEDVEAAARKVKTGAVRVHKTVHERHEVVDQFLFDEEVEVERVVKNQIVDGPQSTREEGDTTIIPVVKQVLRTEWVLAEEVRLTRRRKQVRVEHPVTVLHEEAEVERIDEAGKPETTERRGPLGGTIPSFVGKLKR